jgi:hypothetical protein
MPIGANAIPPSLPYTQYEPRCACQQEEDEVISPGFLPHPAQAIEGYDSRVKNHEKDIEQMIAGHKTIGQTSV